MFLRLAVLLLHEGLSLSRRASFAFAVPTASSLCLSCRAILIGMWRRKKRRKEREKRTLLVANCVTSIFFLVLEEDLWGWSMGERFRSEVEICLPHIGGIYNARTALWGVSICLSFPLGLTRGRRPPTGCSLCRVTNEMLKRSPWPWDSSSLSCSFYPSINVT